MPHCGLTLSVLLHMISHTFQFFDLCLMLFAYLIDDVLESLFNRQGEYLPALLRTQDRMRVAGIEHVPVTSVGRLIHSFSLQHRAIYVKSICSRISGPFSLPTFR